MGRADFYDHGNHNMQCDRCDQKFKRSEMRETWDHKWVCWYDFEERQPQDLLRALPDRQSIEDPRPEGLTTGILWNGSEYVTCTSNPPEDSFLDTNEVTADSLGNGSITTLLETGTGLILYESGTCQPLVES